MRGRERGEREKRERERERGEKERCETGMRKRERERDVRVEKRESWPGQSNDCVKKSDNQLRRTQRENVLKR